MIKSLIINILNSYMRIKEFLIDFYEELKDDNNQIYDINGIRCKISSKAEKLLNIIDYKSE